MSQPESQRGMTPPDEWKRTSVHQASRYSCAKCGQRFALPHEVYDHLDAEHPKPSKDKRTR